MTRGLSLSAWDQAGILSREMALYEKFIEEGHTVLVVSHGGPEEMEYENRFPGLKVLCNKFGLQPILYCQLLPLLHWRQFQNATVFKTNQSRGLKEAVRCSLIFNKPLAARCGFMWSFTEDQNGDARAFKVAFAEEKTGFRHARACIVTTEVMRNYLIDKHHISDDKIHVLPNYVVQDFYNAPSVTEKKKDVIRAVGRLAPEKNLFNLIEASVGLDAKLEIIGQGPLHDELKQHAKKVGADLTLLGAVDHNDLPSLLASSTIFVQVSKYEGHPKTILEAMACGLPIVGTNVTGIRDVINHEETGLLCEPDAQSIRDTLKRLLASPEQRTKMGQAAKVWANRYALDTIVSKELALYETISQQASRLTTMKQSFNNLAGRFIGVLVGPRLRSRTLNITVRIIQAMAGRMPPKDSLQFLFSLDDAMYKLQSDRAIEFGKGLHPKHRLIAYHDFFLSHLNNDDTVIDVGCGNGALAYSLATTANARVTGIDINRESIQKAREEYSHPNLKFMTGDATKDIPSSEYDVVVLSNILEHIENRPEVLKSIVAAVTPSKVLIRVPLFDRDWRVPLKKELGIEWRLDPTHETEYTHKQFINEVTEAGLTITQMETRWGEIWAVLTP